MAEGSGALAKNDDTPSVRKSLLVGNRGVLRIARFVEKQSLRSPLISVNSSVDGMWTTVAGSVADVPYPSQLVKPKISPLLTRKGIYASFLQVYFS